MVQQNTRNQSVNQPNRLTFSQDLKFQQTQTTMTDNQDQSQKPTVDPRFERMFSTAPPEEQVSICNQRLKTVLFSMYH